jgi:hypothetical protein
LSAKSCERVSSCEAILAIGFVALSVAELSDSPIIQRSWSDDNGGPAKWPLPHIENSPSA